MKSGLPSLPFESWRDTLATLHRCVQIVGKVQLALTPRVNHFWNAAFLVGASGLRTPAIPAGDRTFCVELDFVEHNLVVRTSDDQVRGLALIPRPVADFYRDFMEVLAALEIDVSINDRPVELQEKSVRFSEDREHAAYDPRAVERCWQILSFSARVFEEFRGRFVGKSSPVLFWWGSFDLAVSRFSGRTAPINPGADAITAESYSHEVSSAGFWPGDVRYRAPAYYAYTVPAPNDLDKQQVLPADAFWSPELGEFMLPYEAIRTSDSPRERLLDFLQSTYEAGATLAGWDRGALERQFVQQPQGDTAEQEAASHPPLG